MPLWIGVRLWWFHAEEDSGGFGSSHSEVVDGQDDDQRRQADGEVLDRRVHGRLDDVEGEEHDHGLVEHIDG